ncbi:MAG: ATP-binding protein, partial [Acidobacteria bacterium]|nr:ATP-binding protein [Acidobacteriota bacterium]
SPDVRLGVVSGRRRQGKTFLLTSLADQTSGFFFAASETTEADALRPVAYLVKPFGLTDLARALEEAVARAG